MTEWGSVSRPSTSLGTARIRPSAAGRQTIRKLHDQNEEIRVGPDFGVDQSATLVNDSAQAVCETMEIGAVDDYSSDDII